VCTGKALTNEAQPLSSLGLTHGSGLWLDETPVPLRGAITLSVSLLTSRRELLPITAFPFSSLASLAELKAKLHSDPDCAVCGPPQVASAQHLRLRLVTSRGEPGALLPDDSLALSKLGLTTDRGVCVQLLDAPERGLSASAMLLRVLTVEQKGSRLGWAAPALLTAEEKPELDLFREVVFDGGKNPALAELQFCLSQSIFAQSSQSETALVVLKFFPALRGWRVLFADARFGPEQPVAQPAENSDDSGKQDAADVAMWGCPLCTFVNDKSAAQCEMCASERPLLKKLNAPKAVAAKSKSSSSGKAGSKGKAAKSSPAGSAGSTPPLTKKPYSLSQCDILAVVPAHLLPVWNGVACDEDPFALDRWAEKVLPLPPVANRFGRSGGTGKRDRSRGENHEPEPLLRISYD
jgi:hypothetical protein